MADVSVEDVVISEEVSVESIEDVDDMVVPGAGIVVEVSASIVDVASAGAVVGMADVSVEDVVISEDVSDESIEDVDDMVVPVAGIVVEVSAGIVDVASAGAVVDMADVSIEDVVIPEDVSVES